MRACTLMTGEQRLIGPRHINSLKRLPAGIHIRTVPRPSNGEVPLRVPERNTAGFILRKHPEILRCLSEQKVDV